MTDILYAGFFERYGTTRVHGLPKYAQLREALLAAIADGYWQPGSQLPPESELTRITPFSLGTVQKALRALAEAGVVVRRQGHGTFISDSRPQMSGPWHCRFVGDEEGTFLPVYPRVVLRTRMVGDGPWSPVVSRPGGEAVQIDRVFNIDDEFEVYAKFFVGADRFGPILAMANEVLERSNFKALLRQEFNVTITDASQTVQMMPFADHICDAIGVARGTVGLVLSILAGSGPRTAVYYHELLVPPTRRRLYISDASDISAFHG